MSSATLVAIGLFLFGNTLNTAATFNLITQVFKTQHYRPSSIFLDRFERNASTCERCDKAVDNDMKLVLNVRANGDSNVPSEPPKNLNRYQATLQKIIDRYRGKIDVLVIESEPDLEQHYWAGTAPEYLKLLHAACEVAHKNKIRCTDGGVSSRGIAALLADHYLEKNQPEKALSFYQRISNSPIKTVEQIRESLTKRTVQLDKAKKMLYGFRASGVDYLNLHWYEKDRSAFLEVIEFLKKAGSGLPVMSDELGQRNDDAAETIWKLDIAQRAKFPFIVWHSADTSNSRSLVNSDGTLRPTGEAFRRVTAK